MNALDLQHAAGVMTIIQEAGNQSDIGQLAVAYVIRNACKYWDHSVTDEVFKSNRYSCWRTGSVTLMNLDQATDIIVARASVAMLSAWHYLLPDPTNGAVFYLNPVETRRLRGGTLPDWWNIDAYAAGEVVIGDHAFRPPVIQRA